MEERQLLKLSADQDPAPDPAVVCFTGQNGELALLLPNDAQPKRDGRSVAVLQKLEASLPRAWESGRLRKTSFCHFEESRS